MKKKGTFGLTLGFLLTAAVWFSIPQQVLAGPGDGKGKQYWCKRYSGIGCDNSTIYSCSTGGKSCSSGFEDVE